MNVDQKHENQIYQRVRALPRDTRWWGTEPRARFIRDWEQITEKLNQSGVDLSRIPITGGAR